MQRFQEERQMLRSTEKKASSRTVCGWRKPGRKIRGRERKEGVGTGWDERARGEDAVPMVHQKLMPTASVSRSRSGKTTHANSLESPASALPPSLPPYPSPAPTPSPSARAPSHASARSFWSGGGGALWALTPWRVHRECRASNCRKFRRRSRCISAAPHLIAAFKPSKIQRCGVPYAYKYDVLVSRAQEPLFPHAAASVPIHKTWGKARQSAV